jgi:hypothetical protein
MSKVAQCNFHLFVAPKRVELATLLFMSNRSHIHHKVKEHHLFKLSRPQSWSGQCLKEYQGIQGRKYRILLMPA